MFVRLLPPFLALLIAPITAHSSSMCGYWFFKACESKEPVLFFEANDHASKLEKLGEKIFFDTNLSEPRGQSCASCHDPDTGFTEPNGQHGTSLGADGVSFGTRNSSTLHYAAYVPDFEMALKPDPGATVGNLIANGVDVGSLTPTDMIRIFQNKDLQENPQRDLVVKTPQSTGGFFIDGRAASLEEQAKEPFFNPKEMALSSASQLRQRVSWSDYSWEFEQQFGWDVLHDDERTLDGVAKALAAFQRAEKLSPFTSKFDRVSSGQDTFTDSEARGQALFNGKAGCAFCHKSPDDSEELFSDFVYHNVGAPRNFDMLNKIGDMDFIDRGRFSVSDNLKEDGQYRTPTLRNIAKTAPYMHNGVFFDLHEVVRFYNVRDIDIAFTPELKGPSMTPPPLVGKLGLSEDEIDDIVAFLHTLTDEEPHDGEQPGVGNNILSNGDFSSVESGKATNWSNGCSGSVSADGASLYLAHGACVDQSFKADDIRAIASSPATYSCLIKEVDGYSDMAVYFDGNLIAEKAITTADRNTRVKLTVNAPHASSGFVSLYSEGSLRVDDCTVTSRAVKTEPKPVVVKPVVKTEPKPAVKPDPKPYTPTYTPVKKPFWYTWKWW